MTYNHSGGGSINNIAWLLTWQRLPYSLTYQPSLMINVYVCAKAGNFLYMYGALYTGGGG